MKISATVQYSMYTKDFVQNAHLEMLFLCRLNKGLSGFHENISLQTIIQLMISKHSI